MELENLDNITEFTDISNLTGTQVLIRRLLSNMQDGVLKSYLNSVLPDVVSFFWSVILALIVYAIGVRIIRLVIKIIRKPLEKRGTEQGVVQFISSLAKAAMYILLAVIILTLFGVSTSSIAAAVASVGLAAGLALQGSLSNFAGGVLILILKPFVVGDYIIEHTHNNEGTVSEITIFYTKLKTIDNKIIVIPNGILANSSLTNATMSDRRMVHLTVAIGYDADIKRAKEILKDIIEAEKHRLEEEKIQIYVDDLAESAVNIGVRFWVPTEYYWEVRWRTLEEIKYRLDENKITIPFNQLDVHISPLQND